MASPGASDATRLGLAFSEHLIALAYFRARAEELPEGGEGKAAEASTMVDVGAFDGATCLPFLEMGWTVHAFEPDPIRAADLRRLDTSGFHLHQVAVSDLPRAEAAWYVDPAVPSISSLTPFTPDHRERGSVEVTTLTAAFARSQVTKVDYLKVDAEGFDLQVLRGFPWSHLLPEVIVCEFEDRKTRALGYDTGDLVGLLVSKGFKVFVSEWEPIERYGGSHSWRRIVPWPVEIDPEAWGNLLAVVPAGSARLERSISQVISTDRACLLRELEKLRSSQQAMRGDLSQRNETIRQLRAGLTRREETIGQLQEAVGARDAALARLRKAIEERDTLIARLRSDPADQSQPGSPTGDEGT